MDLIICDLAICRCDWIIWLSEGSAFGDSVARRRYMSEADDLQARVEVFADRSIQFVDGLPNTLIAQRIAGQLLDASTSVAGNYRAARRGRSHAEFTAKLGIVSEEADESVYCTNVELEPLLGEAIELSKIFAASARTARSRRCRK